MFACRVLCFILCFLCVSCFLVSCFVLCCCAGFFFLCAFCFVFCVVFIVFCGLFLPFCLIFWIVITNISYELYFSSICPFLLFPTLKSNPRLGVLQGPFPLPPPFPLNFYRTGASTSSSPPRFHPRHRWSLKICWWWILSGRESSFVQSSICW